MLLHLDLTNDIVDGVELHGAIFWEVIDVHRFLYTPVGPSTN